MTLCATTACSRSDAGPRHDTAAVTVVPYAYERVPLDTAHAPGTIIDSVFPMPEMLRRFRVGLPATSRLAGGAESKRALVERFVAALAARDTATLSQLVMTRAEFAYLYFPNSADAVMPAGLPPQQRWGQLLLHSEQGIARALTRLGGVPWALSSFDCPVPPVTAGPLRLHDRCTLRMTAANQPPFEGRLFGSILEYAGRFKFAGFSNDM